MLLAELVDRSSRLTATRSRKEKLDLLAGLLRRLDPPEVPVAVGFLSGSAPQGKIGIGGAAIRALRRSSAPSPSPALGLLEVNAALDRLAAIRGRGSAAARRRELGELFARATAPEQE